jgi:hypothetical protein
VSLIQIFNHVSPWVSALVIVADRRDLQPDYRNTEAAVRSEAKALADLHQVSFCPARPGRGRHTQPFGHISPSHDMHSLRQALCTLLAGLVLWAQSKILTLVQART